MTLATKSVKRKRGSEESSSARMKRQLAELATAKGKATTFHSFAKLPTEIQVEIWKLAADELLTNARQMMDAFYSRAPPRELRTPRSKKKAVIKRRASAPAEPEASSDIGICLHQWPLLGTSALSRDAEFVAIRLYDKGEAGSQQWWFEIWNLKQRKIFMVDVPNYHKVRNAGQLERPDDLEDEEVDDRWRKEVVDFRPIRKSERLKRLDKKPDYVEVAFEDEEE